MWLCSEQSIVKTILLAFQLKFCLKAFFIYFIFLFCIIFFWCTDEFKSFINAFQNVIHFATNALFLIYLSYFPFPHKKIQLIVMYHLLLLFHLNSQTLFTILLCNFSVFRNGFFIFYGGKKCLLVLHVYILSLIRNFAFCA